MVDLIPKDIKESWDNWNIRGVVIMSLTLQTILIFFGPMRKRTSRKPIILLIWSSYLLADWAANFAVGLISKNQGKDSKPSDPVKDKGLMAFWAPFLLLHLGGPDTITAFSLADNELWLRHLLGLIFQAVAGVYAVVQSIPNRLWLPISLMFITGTIKYVERTRALYLASLDKFRNAMLKSPDPGPNYAKLMEEYKAKLDSKLPTRILMIEEPDRDQKAAKLVKPNRNLTDLEIVQYAYKYYKSFKGLIVDLIFSFRERDESREFFRKLTDEEALRIIELELSFIYEALYTKVEVLHNWIGTAFRVLALGSLVSAFCVFRFRPGKGHHYDAEDIVITYVLLSVGLALDIAAMVMFAFSDWTFAVLRNPREDPDSDEPTIDKILGWFLSFRNPKWREDRCVKENPAIQVKHEILVTPFFFRRWSGRVYISNFIGFCLKTRTKRIHSIKGYIRLTLETIIHWLFIDRAFYFAISVSGAFLRFVRSWIDRLHKFIDRRINNVSKQNRVLRYLLYPVKLYVEFWFAIPHFLSFLGGYVIDFFGLKDLLDGIRFVSGEPLSKNLWKFIFDEVKYKSGFADDPETAKTISSARGEWTLRDTKAAAENAEPDHETLMRYIVGVDYDQSLLLWHIATELCYQTEEPTEANCSHREFSKIMSDYMIYLLIMQPTLMSAVAGIGKIRFRDTWAEADKFFERRHVADSGDFKLASEIILSVETDVRPIDVKGDRSKSVLFDASMLAKELKKMEKEKKGFSKWEIMSKVWVELLCYAASHCDAKSHAAEVSKGGEVISFVWLLMAHFGLGEQFQIQKGDARAKLIVGK